MTFNSNALAERILTTFGAKLSPTNNHMIVSPSENYILSVYNIYYLLFCNMFQVNTGILRHNISVHFVLS